MQLQTALVGSLDPVFERIETVLRAGADRTGQVFASTGTDRTVESASPDGPDL